MDGHGESRALGVWWLRQSAGCRDSTGVSSALSGGEGLDGASSRRKQRWVTVETGLQGKSHGISSGDRGWCRDRSIRKTSLPALLMDQNFDDARLFVTQSTQRQLLSSGDGFS